MADSKEQNGRRTLRKEILFWFLVVLLWSATVVLLLEAGTILWEKRIASENSLVAGIKEGEAVSSSESGIASHATSCGLLACDVAGLTLSRSVEPLSTGDAFPPDGLLGAGEAPDVALNSFPSLGEAERSAFALVRGEIVFVFDGRGRILRGYGDYVSRSALEAGFSGMRGWLYCLTVGRDFWQALREQCRRATKGDSGKAEVPSIVPNAPPMPVLRLGGRNGEAVCLFIKAFGLSGVDLPANSPWEVPFYRYRANLRQSRGSMGSPLDTNQFGYHDNDFEIPKPHGVFRILCLGGSTTEEGATVEETYPGMLQKRLSEFCPGAKVEVLNCGISGMTSGAQISKLGEYISYEPDLVILYEGLNDLLQTLPALWESSPDHWWRRVFRRSRFIRAAVPLLAWPEDDRLKQDLLLAIVDNLDFLAKAFRSRGIEVAVCTIPYPHPDRVSPREWQYFDYDLRTRWGFSWLSYPLYAKAVRDFNNEIQDWCTKKKVCLLPLDRQFADVPVLFGDICHMFSSGIGRKADAIMEGLLESEKSS